MVNPFLALKESAKSLPTLPSWSPTGVFLPSVARANITRLTWVQKQSKVLFFDQRMQRRQLPLGVCAPPTPAPQAIRAGLLCRGLFRGGRGGSSPGSREVTPLTLQITAPGAASLHAACRSHLELQCRVRRVCTAPSCSVGEALSQ